MNALATAAYEAMTRALHNGTALRDMSATWESIAQAVLVASAVPLTHETGQNARTRAIEMAGLWLRAAGENRLAELLETGVLDLRDEEPVFLLKGRDRLAPGTVREWIASASRANVPEWKIEAAEAALEAMERYPGDRKYPD